MADLRRCRWCRLILVSDAQPIGEGDRRVKAHCGNRACDWCHGCYAQRMLRKARPAP